MAAGRLRALIAPLYNRSGRLRHRLDETGRRVFRILGLESETAGEAIIREASGLADSFDWREG
jgi:hypothetical protein